VNCMMQFTADVTGLELSVADVPESSAWGAALAGLLGLGVYNTLDDLTALPRCQKICKPQMSRETADELYAGWHAAVRRVL
jgi:glycerol kinase